MLNDLERVMILIIQFIPMLILIVIFSLLIGLFTQSYGQVATAFVGVFGVIVGALIAANSKLLMSTYERHHKLRMAALEKRLQAHQEAFALWAKLYNSLRKPSLIMCSMSVRIGGIVIVCILKTKCERLFEILIWMP